MIGEEKQCPICYSDKFDTIDTDYDYSGLIVTQKCVGCESEWVEKFDYSETLVSNNTQVNLDDYDFISCPFCLDPNTSLEKDNYSSEGKNGGIELYVGCSSCSRHWFEVYTFVKISLEQE